MAIQYKQKCKRCNVNFVLVGRNFRYVVCAECQKKEMSGEITDPAMKKLFNIPQEYYSSTPFLRNIKISYLKYGSLSEKQIDTFTSIVADLKKTEKKDKK